MPELLRTPAAAIKAARPGYDDQTVDSARAEAAIDALQPFLVKLIDATQNGGDA